ncbi:hypothetical protein GCM10009789_19360 [Kribbella sancticallisti]|uniref:DUF8168 domain-containing protein n=1 Tax=Kribbella sancticallisti TaxID=460087 RepID=A0ABN2D0P5_9ACTN
MSNSPDTHSDDSLVVQAESPRPEQMLAVVTGLVHPNRLGWTYDEPIQYTFDGARCQLSVMLGLFNVFIEADRPDDFATFLNRIGAIVQGCLDSLGFFLAAPLRGEILSMIVDGKELHYRKLQWDEFLPKGSDETRVEAVKLQPFTRMAIEEPLVRLALADLRTALDLPGETVVLCYRAIESIRQWFLYGDADDDSARKQSWIDLKTHLDIKREEIKPLEAMATSRRHGADTAATERQRVEALTLARKVVERFVAYRVSLTAPPPSSDQ